MQSKILTNTDLDSMNTATNSAGVGSYSVEELIELAALFENGGQLRKAHFLWNEIHSKNSASWAAAKGLLRLNDIAQGGSSINDFARVLHKFLKKWPSRRQEIYRIYEKTALRMLSNPANREFFTCEKMDLLRSLERLGIATEDACHIPYLLMHLLKVENLAVSPDTLDALWSAFKDDESLPYPILEGLSDAFFAAGMLERSAALWRSGFQLANGDWIGIRKCGEALLRAGLLDRAHEIIKNQERLGKLSRSNDFPPPGYTDFMLSRHADLMNRAEVAMDYAASAVRGNPEHLCYAASLALKYGNDQLLTLMMNFHYVHKSTWSFPQAQVYWLAVATQSVKMPHSITTACYSTLLTSICSANLLSRQGMAAVIRNRFFVVNSEQVRNHPVLAKFFRFAPDLIPHMEFIGCEQAHIQKHAACITLATVNTYSVTPKVIVFKGSDFDYLIEEPSKHAKVAEVFIPGACFTSKDQETRAHVEIRNMFDRLMEGLIKLGIPVLPRHQYRNGYADPSGFASHVFSYHTHGEHRGSYRHYHFKESHLPGTYHFETGGYSGWSTIASRPHDTSWFRHHDKREAKKYVHELHHHLVQNNLSKYEQPQNKDSIPRGRYVVLILQIIDDVVARFAHIKPDELVQTAVSALKSTGVNLIIKRHPLCRSPIISELLKVAASEPHVFVSTASIHSLYARADAVITTNSGAGFEAIIHGKAVITVGSSDYAGYSHSCKNTRELEDALATLVRKSLYPVEGWELFIQNYLELHVQKFDQPDRFMEKLKEALSEEAKSPLAPEDPSKKIPMKLLIGMSQAATALDAAGYDSAASILWERIDVTKCGNSTILESAMSAARLRGDQNLWLELRNSGEITNPDFLFRETVDMAVRQNDYSLLCRLMEDNDALADGAFHKLADAYLQFSSRFNQPPVFPARLLKFEKLPEALLLTLLQNLIQGGRLEEAKSLIQHLDETTLAFGVQNKLHELKWRYNAEIGDRSLSLNNIGAVRWKTEYQTSLSLKHYIARLDLEPVPGIRNLVIATDVDFTSPGLGSHARIMSIAQRCSKLPKVRLIVAYFGRIERPMFIKDFQRQNFTMIPVCAVPWISGDVTDEEYSSVVTDEYPLTRLSPGVSRLLKSNFCQLMDLLRPEWVIFEYLWSAFLTEPARHYTAILDAHDVQSSRSSDIDARGLTNFYPLNEESEANALSKFDVIMAINEADASKFKEIAPDKQVISEPHFDELPDSLPIPKGIRKIGFVGGPQQPNVEGINDFILNLWPHAPEGMELHVYGNVCKYISIPSDQTQPVFLHGFVEDLSMVYANVDAVIAPLLTGSGLKIKVVEAMSYGRLVLTTPVGAQGIPVEKLANPIVYHSSSEFWACLLGANEKMLSDAARTGRDWLAKMQESSELERLLGG